MLPAIRARAGDEGGGVKFVRITLRRGRRVRRIILFTQDEPRPLVGDEVTIKGERWRATRLELVDVLVRIPVKGAAA